MASPGLVGNLTIQVLVAPALMCVSVHELVSLHRQNDALEYVCECMSWYKVLSLSPCSLTQDTGKCVINSLLTQDTTIGSGSVLINCNLQVQLSFQWRTQCNI